MEGRAIMASLSHDEKVAKLKSAVDFVQRYDEGPPDEGISGDEALGNFEAVSSNISNDDFQAALTDSYARLSQDQRSQLSEMVRQRAPGQLDNVNFNDPQEFAQAATSFGSGGPAGLTELLGISGATNAVDGGGGGGMLSGLLGGLLGGGDSDNRSQQGAQSQGLESLISNPIVRALLGGIAAYAMKRMFGGAGGGGSRSSSAGATGGGIEDMLGGLLGGGGGGNLDDILGGLVGGSGSGKGGGSLDDILGGLVGGGGQSGQGGSSPLKPKSPGKDRSREI
jgi:hypothetical protein